MWLTGSKPIRSKTSFSRVLSHRKFMGWESIWCTNDVMHLALWRYLPSLSYQFSIFEYVLVGSWQPRKCPLWKGVFDQMLAVYWSSSYTRVTMWASTAPIITKCPEYNNRNSMTTIGTLRSNDATAMRTSLKKWIYVLSVFIAIIPTHLLCQM